MSMKLQQLPYSKMMFNVNYNSKDKTQTCFNPTGSCNSEIAKGLLLQDFCVSEVYFG